MWSTHCVRLGLNPVCQLIVRIEPVSDMAVHIYLLACTKCIVTWNLLTYWRVAEILTALPAVVGVQHRSLPLTQQYETWPNSGIGNRLELTFTPYLSCHHVLAGSEILGDVESLIVPVFRIVACRTQRCKMTIDI